MDIKKFHSGEATYLLNGDQMEFLFGQELDSDNNMPVVYSGTNRVYKTVFMYNGNEYAVLYNNTEMKFHKILVPAAERLLEDGMMRKEIAMMRIQPPKLTSYSMPKP